MEPWRKTMYAVAAAQFIALGGGNLVFPFMPFYVEELGITDKSQIALWSGLLGTATGAMLFIFSPIWGSLADRYGRKPLLLRAYIGAMITMSLQGAVQEVWQLLALRALQGAFVGTIPAATALVASKTPRAHVGYALGVLQMGLFLSQFAGPLVGGSLAATIGIRPTFWFTAGFYLVSFFLVYTQVDEEFERPKVEDRTGFVDNLRLVASIRPLLALIGIVFLLNTGPPFVRPVIPILVDSFDSSLSAESLSGIAFAALAATSAVAALASSRLSQLAGYRNALALVTLAAGLAYLPVAMANNVPSLIVFIGIVGLFSGAMIPTVNTLIDAWAPPGRQASVFGLVGSAMALAFAVAPLTGGAVASAWGVDTSFIVIGGLTIAVSGAIFLFVRGPGEAPVPSAEGLEPAEAAGGPGE